MIQVQCPSCKKRYNVPDKAAGRTARCHCGSKTKIGTREVSGDPTQVEPVETHWVEKLPAWTVVLLDNLHSYFERDPRRRIGSAIGGTVVVTAALYIVSGFVWARVDSREPTEIRVTAMAQQRLIEPLLSAAEAADARPAEQRMLPLS